MLSREMKAFAHRFIEEWNKGEAATLAAMDEMFAADFVIHSGTGEDTRSLKDFMQHVSDFFRVVPDGHVTIDDMMVEGDKLACRWTLTGTYKTEPKDASPANKRVTTWVITIYRFAGGKFAESWERYDTLGFMQQLSPVRAQMEGRK